MNTILLQVEGSSLTSIIFLVGMFVVMYFFMIRPQQQKTKAANKFRDSLSKGQEIITAGGIFGKITEIKGEVVTLEISRSTTIKIEKASIATSAEDITNKKS